MALAFRQLPDWTSFENQGANLAAADLDGDGKPELLYVAITRKKVNWMLDCDIRGFFDHLSHDWLLKFVQHRVADHRILRLIQKWLKAGVREVCRTKPEPTRRRQARDV